MRLWHKDLIAYLPDLQLKGQWRECCLIADGLAKNETPNHLLVNKVTEYPLDEFMTYCKKVSQEMYNRGFPATLKSQQKVYFRLWNYVRDELFKGWHKKEYLRVCMANLYEKHFFGVSKSRITDKEWQTLLDGYKNITGEDYVI